jgi:hypothetical protein
VGGVRLDGKVTNMPDRKVRLQRVKTSDLIAIWKVYHGTGSVASGAGMLMLSYPRVENPHAVSLRCASLCLRCPELAKMPAWRRQIVGWFYAKKPLVVNVGPECESFFDLKLTA